MKSVFCKEWYSWKHPIKNILIFFKQVEWGFQRATKGYCEYDSSDIDVWFLSIISGIINDLRRKNAPLQHPAYFLEEYYNAHADEINCLSYDAFVCGYKEDVPYHDWYMRGLQECHKRWMDILDRMIFLFQESSEDTCTTEFENPQELSEYCERCKAEAFSMFSKHFNNLWL